LLLVSSSATIVLLATAVVVSTIVPEVATASSVVVSEPLRVLLTGLNDLSGHVCKEVWVDIRKILVMNLVEALLAKLFKFLLILILQEILLIHDLFQDLLFDVLGLILFDGESGSIQGLIIEVLDRLLG